MDVVEKSGTRMIRRRRMRRIDGGEIVEEEKQSEKEVGLDEGQKD